jgi:hypothetical protein
MAFGAPTRASVESAALYAGIIILFLLGYLSWNGVHDVSVVMLVIMMIMMPVLYCVTFSEASDGQWLKEQAKKPEVIDFNTESTKRIDHILCFVAVPGR